MHISFVSIQICNTFVSRLNTCSRNLEICVMFVIYEQHIKTHNIDNAVLETLTLRSVTLTTSKVDIRSLLSTMDISKKIDIATLP